MSRPDHFKGVQWLIIGDSVYNIDRFYLEGVSAAQRNVPYPACPYRDGSQRAAQWQDGHTHEFAGCHEGMTPAG